MADEESNCFLVLFRLQGQIVAAHYAENVEFVNGDPMEIRKLENSFACRFYFDAKSGQLVSQVDQEAGAFVGVFNAPRFQYMRDVEFIYCQSLATLICSLQFRNGPAFLVSWLRLRS